jgi:hypothetical protein
MKFRLHWLNDGQWHVSDAKAAETFEMYDLTWAIHRPLAGNLKRWCVTEVTTGASLCINLLGTKAEVRSEACRILALSPPENWHRTIAQILKSRH